MSQYNFNKIIERQDSGALKTDALQQRYGRPDLQALWVADMDFATPDFIIDAIKQRLDHPILGYTVEPEKYRTSIIDWQRKLHNWEIKPDEISFIPGIVKGIGMAINVFTNPGDGVIIQPPVYHPFRNTTIWNNRKAIENPLKMLPDGSYEMDFDQLERIAPDAKMLLLSNPHNPGGKVWSADTLRRLAEICAKHSILVISDEIHADMTIFGHTHTPYATVSPEARMGSITFGAPSKTFNIPGIVSSWAVTHNPELRQRFYGWLQANELEEPTIFAPIATIAAYTKGDDWRKEMLNYIENNIIAVEQYLSDHIPAIRAIRPEAGFLVWLDCRALGLNHDRLIDLFVNQAQLALNDGEMFGSQGAGFMRLNVATPNKLLIEALDKLARAIKNTTSTCE